VGAADPQRLRQVLINLFSNAVKYNREGGWVEFGAAQSGSELELLVSDGGHGIAEDKLHRLFRPFERLGAESSGVEGIGLGLAVSKRLIEAMSGSIQASSTQGEGTTFTLRLPPAGLLCQQQAAGSQAAGSQAAGSQAAGSQAAGSQAAGSQAAGSGPAPQVLEAPVEEPAARLVLYIEDNTANAILMEHLVENLPGLSLLVAPDGARGVAAARGEQPDVILLDLNLPDAHGLSLVDELRRSCPQACLAIVSADATREQIVRAQAVGVSRYFTKPLDVGALCEFLSAGC